MSAEPKAEALERRRRLVASYLATGSMAHAMRESGFVNPTHARALLRRFEYEGEEGLLERSRAPRNGRVGDETKDRIIEIRVRNPEWGRRRIAAALGPVGPGPDGVEAVLRTEGFWSRPPSDGVTNFIEVECGNLASTIQAGIQADVADESQRAVGFLLGGVWAQLWKNENWKRLMFHRSLGPLLLRSQLQLAHALMNTGDWRRSEIWLERTLRTTDYINESALRGWSDPGLPVSTAPREVELEAHQYLGTVMRDRRPDLAAGHLQAALVSANKSQPTTETQKRTLGNILRGKAKQSIRNRRFDMKSVNETLDRARGLLRDAGDEWMVAATNIVAADAEHRLLEDDSGAAGRARLAEFLNSVEAVMQRGDSPILEANFSIDSARLLMANGMRADVDAGAITSSAEKCLAYGYGDQARKLMGLNDCRELLPSDLFRRLASLAYWTDNRRRGSPNDRYSMR